MLISSLKNSNNFPNEMIRKLFTNFIYENYPFEFLSNRIIHYFTRHSKRNFLLHHLQHLENEDSNLPDPPFESPISQIATTPSSTLASRDFTPDSTNRFRGTESQLPRNFAKTCGAQLLEPSHSRIIGQLRNPSKVSTPFGRLVSFPEKSRRDSTRVRVNHR